MILNPKKTTLAYRCPSCGTGVMSAVGLFDITADMFKLKCNCKESAMTVVYSKDPSDPKVRLSIPCVLCPNPHTFTVSSSVFFKDDQFILSCPYSGLTLAVVGEENKVKAELSRSELELLDLLEKSGIDSFDSIKAKNDYEVNPEIVEIITYILSELDEENKIVCACEDGKGDFEVDFSGEDAIIECKICKCKKILPTNSIMAAHSLLELDKLTLDPTT